MAAARLLLTYTVGLPTAAVDPDRLDADETRLMTDLTEALGDFRLNAMLNPKVARQAVEQVTGETLERIGADADLTGLRTTDGAGDRDYL